MDSRLISGGTYIKVGEDMTFPNPVSDRAAEVEWRMRHMRGAVTEGDLLIAASIIGAYRELVASKTQKARNACCQAMKAAYQET